MSNGALVYVPYSYVILSVQQCYTVGAAVLHCWYQGAALLVPGCCTFLVLIVSRGNSDCFTGKYNCLTGNNAGLFSKYKCRAFGLSQVFRTKQENRTNNLMPPTQYIYINGVNIIVYTNFFFL